MSNFLLVENGVGITGGWFKTYPDALWGLAPDINAGGSWVTEIHDGLIVGKTPTVAGSVRSKNCDVWTKGGDGWFSEGHKIGGAMNGFKHWTEYGYTGFSAQGANNVLSGAGYGQLITRNVVANGVPSTNTAIFRYLLKGLVFYGFSGKDTCGRRNVAISNEMAGLGEGTFRSLGAEFGALSMPLSRPSSYSPKRSSLLAFPPCSP